MRILLLTGVALLPLIIAQNLPAQQADPVEGGLGKEVCCKKDCNGMGGYVDGKCACYCEEYPDDPRCVETNSIIVSTDTDTPVGDTTTSSINWDTVSTTTSVGDDWSTTSTDTGTPIGQPESSSSIIGQPESSSSIYVDTGSTTTSVGDDWSTSSTPTTETTATHTESTVSRCGKDEVWCGSACMPCSDVNENLCKQCSGWEWKGYQYGCEKTEIMSSVTESTATATPTTETTVTTIPATTPTTTPTRTTETTIPVTSIYYTMDKRAEACYESGGYWDDKDGCACYQYNGPYVSIVYYPERCGVTATTPTTTSSSMTITTPPRWGETTTSGSVTTISGTSTGTRTTTHVSESTDPIVSSSW